MNDMENIKKILSDHEVPYDHNDWIKLEKDLPKSPGMSSVTKYLLVASAILLTITGIYFISQQINSNRSDKDLTQKNDIVNDTENIINEKNDNFGNNLTNNSDIVTINNNNKESLISIIDTIKINKENTEKTNSDIDQINEVINNSNNENTADQTLTPDLSKSAFKVVILDNCTPSKIIFNAENIPENCEVIWNTDDNYRVYGSSAQHSYLDEGKYYPTVSVVFNNFVIKTVNLDEIIINRPSVIKINFENSENLYYFTCINKEELSILWTIDNQKFNEKEISYNFNISGEYSIMLTAVNEFGCKTEVAEKLNIVIEHIYYVPNAFIPTSNGINSEFGPIGENLDFASYKMVIVDGNGNSVFESTSPEFMWNGKINNIGAEAKPGFYLWEILTMDKYGNVQTKKGRVNLIRN